MGKEKSCGVIVYKKNKDGIKYLLLHYEEGHWDFPKGHQKENETEQRTAEREVKEETGIEDLEFAENFRQAVNYYFKKGDEVIYKEVVYFIASTQTEKITLSKEHIGYAWTSFEHTIKKLTYDTSKELLKKANNFLI